MTTYASNHIGLCASGGDDLAAVVFHAGCDLAGRAGEGLYEQGQRGAERAKRMDAWRLFFSFYMALVHVEHSSMYQRNEEIWKHYPENREGMYSRADGMVGCGWVARYSLEFLDAYLKRDAAAMGFLKKTPAENDVPPHLMTVNFRAAKGATSDV